MDDDRDKQQARADEQLEQEIRRGRKFTATEAMARLAGPGAMKGASPVSPIVQAEAELATWLASNIQDTGGALKVVLHRQLKGSRVLLDSLDRPLTALAAYCRHILKADNLVKELVRETDVEWGRSMDERPHFEREGAAPHPDDPYTVETVRRILEDMLKLLPDRDS